MFRNIRLIEPSTGQVDTERNGTFGAQHSCGPNRQIGMRNAFQHMVTDTEFIT